MICAPAGTSTRWPTAIVWPIRRGNSTGADILGRAPGQVNAQHINDICAPSKLSVWCHPVGLPVRRRNRATRKPNPFAANAVGANPSSAASGKPAKDVLWASEHGRGDLRDAIARHALGKINHAQETPARERNPDVFVLLGLTGASAGGYPHPFLQVFIPGNFK